MLLDRVVAVEVKPTKFLEGLQALLGCDERRQGLVLKGFACTVPGTSLPSTPPSLKICLARVNFLTIKPVLSLFTEKPQCLPFTYSTFIYYRRPFGMWPCLYPTTSFLLLCHITAANCLQRPAFIGQDRDRVSENAVQVFSLCSRNPLLH